MRPPVHAYEPAERHGRDRDAPSDLRPSTRPRPSASTRDGCYKTLVASVDGRLVLAVVPVDRELDLKRLADAVGGRRAVMAEPGRGGAGDRLRRRRDQPARARGGRCRSSSTPAALDLATIFVSAGRRGLQLELAPRRPGRV